VTAPRDYDTKLLWFSDANDGARLDIIVSVVTSAAATSDEMSVYVVRSQARWGSRKWGGDTAWYSGWCSVERWYDWCLVEGYGNMHKAYV
jgi:hypothetical protein